MATINQFPANYHVLEVTYIGATDTKPSAVRIKSHRFRQTVDTRMGNNANARDAAIEWLVSNGFEVTGQGEKANGYYLMSTTFEPLRK